MHARVCESDERVIIVSISTLRPAFYRPDVFPFENNGGKWFAVDAWTLNEGEIEIAEPLSR
jgi:hypothetical protein